MSIFDRLTRLLSANVNDLLDRAEDPEKMIEQVLRDMGASLSEARTATVAMIAQEKELAGEVDQARRLTDEWGRKALAAVNAGKDDLAREALRRKQDNEANANLYEQQHQVQVQAVAQIKDQLRQLEAKQQATIAQRDALIIRAKRAQTQKKVAATLSTYTPYDPSAELDRMERKIRNQEAQAAALTETASSSWDAQFRTLDDPAIEVQLQALKAYGEAALSPGRRPEIVTGQVERDIEREFLALKELTDSGPSST